MNIAQFDTYNILWPTFVFHYKYENYKQDKNQLVDTIYKEAEKQKRDVDSGVATHLKSNLKESDFNFLNIDNPAIHKLKKFFEQSLSHLVTQGFPSTGYWQPKRPMSCTIRESWYHITNDKGYHLTHVHPGTSWGAIFYAQSSECDLDSMNGTNTWFNFNTHQGTKDDGAEWFEQHYSYTKPPTEGDLILFPGWIPHDAAPYAGEEDRIVVSANTNFYYER